MFTFLAVSRPAVRGDVPMYVLGYLAVMLSAAAIGSWISIAKPVKPRQVGMTRRSPGGIMGVVGFLSVLAMGAAVVLAVLAVRALTPAPEHQIASLAAAGVMLLVACGVWWISLDRNADQLETHREIMIDVLAKSADA